MQSVAGRSGLRWTQRISKDGVLRIFVSQLAVEILAAKIHPVVPVGVPERKRKVVVSIQGRGVKRT